MKYGTLQTKRAMRTALLVLLLGVAGMGKGYAGFDFSAVCSSGQTLYYRIINGTNHYVEIVSPSVNWQGYEQERPKGNLVLSSSVMNGGNVYTVISIDSYAFHDCSLLSITIPSSINTIQHYAFTGCNYLTTVTLSPVIGASVDYTGLAGCQNLKSVFFTGDIVQWCESAYGQWFELSRTGYDLYIDNTLVTTLVIPDGITTIPSYAFANCCSITSVTIPNSVTEIGQYAFSNCSGLTGEIVLPNRLTSIGYRAFASCIGLTGNLVIPDSVTSIGPFAFEWCDGFTSLTIGKTVTTINKGAFKGCDGVTSINYNAINCATYSTYYPSIFDCTVLTELNIGENVQTIPANAFNGCSGVTSLSIPNSVTSIGASAFNGFNGTSVTIPQSVASIGTRAFGGCARLITVYYDAENAVGSSVFYNCPNLTTIHVGANVQEIHPVFGGCSSVHLVVALGPTPAVLDGNALTDIAQNSILMVSCGKRITYFSVWNMFEFNNIMEDCDTYSVSMNGVGSGGSVSASTTNAQMGEVVELTVTPNAGMTLSSISVVNASDPSQTIPVLPVGKAASNYRFVMPPFAVSVVATFKASGTSVGEYNNIEASVYPNPTNGQVTIEAEGIKHVSISNMLGQIVYDGKASGDEFSYDFGKHEAGIYIIRIETTEGVATKRVVVTR